MQFEKKIDTLLRQAANNYPLDVNTSNWTKVMTGLAKHNRKMQLCEIKNWRVIKAILKKRKRTVKALIDNEYLKNFFKQKISNNDN